MTKFVAFLRDESGASAAEYVLILAIVGTVIVTAVGGLATAIGTKINATATVINP
jgi:pilus assembly protein Flp/PilA